MTEMYWIDVDRLKAYGEDASDINDPLEAKRYRQDILESLRVLSPEGIAKLAQAANTLMKIENTDEGTGVNA